jgi:hypothetical protein
MFRQPVRSESAGSAREVFVARWYVIDGVRFYRRSLIKLSANERAALAATGRAILRYPVEWPLADHAPDFARAYTDPGGTDIWGPGPYLKVPSRIVGDDRWEPVNRVFCPWGYPSDRVRIAHSSVYLQLTAVELARAGPAAWEWILSVIPWVGATRQPSHAEPRTAPARPRD